MRTYEADWEAIKVEQPQSVQFEEVRQAIHVPPETFVDVGPGNIGSEAWEVVKYWPTTTILGMEPCRHRYKILKQHSFPGRLISVTITDEVGETEGLMGYEGGKSDFALTFPYSDPNYRRELVRTFTLDFMDGLIGFGSSVFIWADIEGSELMMLRGAEKLLGSGRVVGLNLELWNPEIEPATPRWCKGDEVVRFLSDRGFVSTSPIWFDDIQPTHSDFVFVPE